MSERPALHYEAQINDTQNRNTDKKKKQEIRMFYKISKQFFFILCFFVLLNTASLNTVGQTPYDTPSASKCYSVIFIYRAKLSFPVHTQVLPLKNFFKLLR